MNGRSKYLVKNIGILTLSNFASKILVFLLVPLYTSVLSTEEYGSYDIVYSTIQLLFPILTLNVSDAVMRFSMEKEKKLEDVAAIGFSTLIRGTVPVIIFMLGCWKWGWIESLRGLEILILLYTVFYFLYQYLIQMSKGMERVIDMGIAGIISTVFLLGGNVILLLVFKVGLKGFYIANVLAQMIPAIYLLIRIKIWSFPLLKKIDRKLKREMLIYCIPLIVTVLGWWVNNTADKYTVAVICGTSANGLLSVSYKIPSIINVLQSIFIQAWQISAIKEYGSDNTKTFYGEAFNILAILMAISGAFLILLTKPIGHLMYAKDFYVAWMYVPFLIVSCILNSASGFLGPILSAKKDSKSMAMSAVYSSVANVILNILLVFSIGVQGACVATAISSLIQYLARKKAVGNDIIIEKYSVVWITWLLLVVQALLEIYTSFWWAEIIIICIMLIINMHQINIILCMLKSMLHKRTSKENSSINTN